MEPPRKDETGPDTPRPCPVCEIDRNASLLGECPVFMDLPRDILRLFAYLARRCRFRTGETVMLQGEVEGRAYLVASGCLTAVREHEGRAVERLVLGRGSFLGGLTLLSGVPRQFSVTADMDTECLALDRAEARKVLIKYPEHGLRIIDRIVTQAFDRRACGLHGLTDRGQGV